MSIRALTAEQYYAKQFFRPPGWRSERSFSIAKRTAGRIRASEEDPLVMQAAEYHRADTLLRQRNYNEFERGRRLAARYPEIHSAYEIQLTVGHSMPRISLESQILAGVDDAVIARRLVTDPEVIAVYRRLLYDVTDRLDSIEYIAGYVIGPVFQAGLDALNTELLAKYFGYFGGPMVLDTMLYGMTRSVGINSDGEVIGYLEQTVNRNLKQQVATATLLMQPTQFNVRTLIEGYTAILTLEHALREGQEEQAWLSGLIDAMRMACPMPRSTEDYRQHASRVNAPPRNLPLEPRLQQRISLAKGELTTEELSDKLAKFSLPTPGEGFQMAGEAPR